MAVFTAARPGKEVTDLCEQFFRFPVNKISAVESSSHAPSRASGRLSRGAAQFFCRRTVSIGSTEVAQQKAARVYVCWRDGRFSARMETTRIRDGLVFLNGGWNGVAGCEKVWVIARSALRRCDPEAPMDNESLYCPDAVRDFFEHGMIFARKAITPRVWRNRLKKRKFNRNRGKRYRF